MAVRGKGFFSYNLFYLLASNQLFSCISLKCEEYSVNNALASKKKHKRYLNFQFFPSFALSHSRFKLCIVFYTSRPSTTSYFSFFSFQLHIISCYGLFLFSHVFKFQIKRRDKTSSRTYLMWRLWGLRGRTARRASVLLRNLLLLLICRSRTLDWWGVRRLRWG